MSNDVNIRVTGSNTSGASVNAAKQDVKQLGDEAQKTAKRVVEMGAAEELAARGAKKMSTELDEAGDQADQLARKLLEATAAAKLLGSTDASPHTGKGGKSGGGLLGNIVKDAPTIGLKAGEEAAGTFASAFQGGIMGAFKALPPEAKAALGAAVGGAAIAAAPLIVSAVNGAILGGIGLGGLAAGIALQARDPVVVGAFQSLGTHIMADLGKATTPFRAQLLTVADDFGKSWTKITPNVTGFFSTLAPMTSKLGEGVSKAVETLGPALERAAGPAAKIIGVIAEEVPNMAREIGNLLDDISEHGDSAAAAIRFILVSVEALIRGFDVLVQTVGPAADTITHMAEQLGLINSTPLDHVITRLQDTPDAANAASGSISDLASSTYNTADAANALNDAWGRLFGQMMSLDEANLKVAEDFRELAGALKKTNGNLQEGTEAGDRNRAMILGMIQDLEAQRQAAIANGNGTVEATRKANAAYLSQLEKIRAVAAANGANTAELDRMIAKYRQLASLPAVDKTVTLTTIYKTKGDKYGSAFGEGSPVGHGFERADAKRTGGIIGAASGGMHSGLIAVGEEGMELVQLPSGSQVYTAGQSQRMMSGGGGPGPTMFVLKIDPGSSPDWLAEAVMAGLRENRITISAKSIVGS